MYNNRVRNIIINQPDRKSRIESDDTLMQLAEYYTRVYAGIAERMHMTDEQKQMTLLAVRTECHELLSPRGCVGMVS